MCTGTAAVVAKLLLGVFELLLESIVFLLKLIHHVLHNMWQQQRQAAPRFQHMYSSAWVSSKHKGAGGGSSSSRNQPGLGMAGRSRQKQASSLALRLSTRWSDSGAHMMSAYINLQRAVLCCLPMLAHCKKQQ